MSIYEEKDTALNTVEIKEINPAKDPLYFNRKWQGIPGIEKSLDGRLFVTFYSGGNGEGSENFLLFLISDDNGLSWSNPLFTVDPQGPVRAFDPCLWLDPTGRLWWFWSQSYTLYDGRAGVWAATCDIPDSERLTWSKPRRICNGIMMNKPIVSSDGEWLLPCAVWACKDSNFNILPEEQYSNIYISKDNGNTFEFQGSADVPDRAFDEHMVVERKDKSLWMLVRTKYGIGQSSSSDKGKTWSLGEPTDLKGPNSRFFIRRLNSGNLLLINHYNFTGRSHLTAFLSKDDGLTWKGCLLLDERSSVSYPDGVQDKDGTIYVVYDRERKEAREILLATFTEADILAGKCITDKSRLKVIVNKI